MHTSQYLRISIVAASFLVLAGCITAQAPVNTNTAGNTAGENTNTSDVNTAVENINGVNTNQINSVNESTSAVNSNETVSDTLDTSDWLVYENEDFGFSFKYPDEDPYPNEQYNKDNVWNNKTHVTLETYGMGYTNDDDLTVGWGSDIFMRISILPKNSAVTLEDYAISRIDIENKNNQLTAKYIQANAISSTIDEKEMLTFTFNGSGCCLVNHALGAGETSYTFIDLSSSRKMLVTYLLTNEADARATEHADIFQKITDSIQFE